MTDSQRVTGQHTQFLRCFVLDRNIIKTLSKVREASEDPDLIEYLEETGSSLALPDILGLLNYQVRLFEQCQMHNQPEFVQPAGLCVESARAVTGRTCPTSEVGEDFLGRQPFFLRKLPQLRKVKSKIDPKVRNGPSFRGLQTLTKFGVL